MSQFGADDLELLATFGTGPECTAAFQRFVQRQLALQGNPTLTPSCYTGNRLLMADDQAAWHASDDAPLYTMAVVERTAGVTKSNLRVWMHRGVIQLRGGDAPAAANGFPAYFTLRSVLIITVTAELVRLGVAPKLAGEAAEHWMSSGVVEGQIGAPARREAGGLYPLPMLTYLVMPADGGPTSSGEVCELVGVAPDDARAHNRLFAGLFARGRPSARIILLNNIDQRVRYACQEALLGDLRVAQGHWDKLLSGVLTEEPRQAVS